MKSRSITFFRRRLNSGDRDLVTSGPRRARMYARAYLEGRIPKEKLRISVAN